MKTLLISAGGSNTRIKKLLNDDFHGIPKHILPLPGKGLTVIETIVLNARGHFDRIQLESNDHNIFFISPLFFANLDLVHTVIDDVGSGPMGPIIRHIQNTGERTYGCAGDFYCNFRWQDFEDFHDSHDFPVSILVAKSVPAPQGARFNLNGSNQISSWERVDETSSNDLINIGVYIVDPTPEVLTLTAKMTHHKEDIFFDLLIANNLLAAFNPGTLGFNINTPIIYKQLCKALSQGI